MKRIYLY